MIAKTLRRKSERLRLTLESGGRMFVAAPLGALGREGFTLISRKSSGATTSSVSRLTRRGSASEQGHSVSVDLGLTALEPPELLFHGHDRCRTYERAGDWLATHESPSHPLVNRSGNCAARRLEARTSGDSARRRAEYARSGSRVLTFRERRLAYRQRF